MAKKKPLTSQEKKKKYLMMAVSLILAIILWMYATNTDNRNTVRSYVVPVEFLNTSVLEDNGLILADMEEVTVKVRVQGTRNAVFSVKKEDIVATVDVGGFGEGEYYGDVNIHVPSNVSVAEVSPYQIRIRIESQVTEDRDVKVSFEGDTSADEEAVCTDISTEIVAVSGARSSVRKVVGLKAVVDVAKLSGQDKTFLVMLVPVDALGQKVENVTSAISTVSVTACLYKVKTVPMTVVTVGEPPGNLELSSLEAPETVILAGPEDELEAITEISTDAVDLSGISSSTEVELKPDIPGNVRLASSQKPIKAVITVRKVTVKTFTYAAEDVELRNVAPGKTAVPSSQSVTIEVKGTDTALDSLSSEDFMLSADCSSLTDGTGMVSVEVALSERAQGADVSVTPGIMEITLSDG